MVAARPATPTASGSGAQCRPLLPDDLLAQADAGVFHPTAGVGGRHWAPGEGGGAHAATSVLPGQRSGA